MPIYHRRLPVLSQVLEVPDKSAKRNADEALIKTEDLALDVEKLYMITEALWTLLKMRGDFTDDHLLKLIKEIDMRDGKPDGRRKRETRPDCQNCGRKMISKSTICLYCGATVKLDPFKKY